MSTDEFDTELREYEGVKEATVRDKQELVQEEISAKDNTAKEDELVQSTPVEQKPGLWTRVKSFVWPDESGSTVLSASSPESGSEIDETLRDDFKMVAKLALQVIKRLPESELAEFKESQEFSQFKDVLRKRQLIK